MLGLHKDHCHPGPRLEKVRPVLSPCCTGWHGVETLDGSKKKKDGAIHKYKVVQPENDGSMPVEYQMHIPVQLLRTPNPSLTHKHPTTRTWGTSQSSSAQKAH